MKSKSFLTALGGILLASSCAALAQGYTPPQQYVPPGVDPAARWPLGAKAGVDSHADKVAPAGAVNTGPYDMTKWKYGHAWDAPSPNMPLWNPVKVKMNEGAIVTGATIPADSNGATYTALANSGVDYIWTEMQHSSGVWQEVHDMWTACPPVRCRAVPGMRVPNANEFDEQHATDQGAMVIVVPTVRSIEEGHEAVKWAYYPPLGSRSVGGGNYTLPEFYRDVPGGYRATFNDNLVLITMIETLDGLRDADKIAALKGVDGVFAASSDLGNFAGYKQGDPDYEREMNIVHDAALRAHKRLCGAWAWLGKPDYSCFQGPGGSESGAPYLGVNAHAPADFADTQKKALGPLWNTQGKVTVGPWAAPRPAM